MSKKLLVTSAIALAIGTSSSAFALQASPYGSKYHNDSDIKITGKISKNLQDGFVLTYGSGNTITVEMDDWDSFDESSYLSKDEVVTVYGDIDEDLYEMRRIEADVVYSHNQHAYYFASDVDEEDYYNAAYYYPKSDEMESTGENSWVSVKGRVANIEGRKFVLKTSKGMIQVDTATLGFNPLDQVGYPQVKEGDTVFVSGIIDDAFYRNKEINAEKLMLFRKGR